MCIYYFAPSWSAKYCDEYVSLSVYSFNSKTTWSIFTKFFMHVACGHSSILICWRCETLSISGFVDDFFLPWGQSLCVGQSADMHMVQLVTLPLTASCFIKSRFVLPFWYRLKTVIGYTISSGLQHQAHWPHGNKMLCHPQNRKYNKVTKARWWLLCNS